MKLVVALFFVFIGISHIPGTNSSLIASVTTVLFNIVKSELRTLSLSPAPSHTHKNKDPECRNLALTELVSWNSHGSQLSFLLLPTVWSYVKLLIHILNKSQRQVTFKLIS